MLSKTPATDPRNISEPTNGGNGTIEISQPYIVDLQIQGAADIIFHRWNCEAIAEKATSKKGSIAKKTDDIETFIWRDDNKLICIPGEYLRQTIINAAKFKQDPRSPRKSAMDLFKAGLVSLTPLAPIVGSSKTKPAKEWEYVDQRRMTVQRQGITRLRPAFRYGWTAEFQLSCVAPEYISPELLYEVVALGGRLVGLADSRPTYGRFNIIKWKLSNAV